MQARYYDPVIGRFYSNDPLGFRDVHSFNRYSYVANNPYKYTDPTGMFKDCASDPNCNVIIGSYVDFYGDELGVPAKYSKSLKNSEGNPQNGEISCDTGCQDMVDVILTDHLALLNLRADMNYRQTQGMLLAAAPALTPVAIQGATITGAVASENAAAAILATNLLTTVTGDIATLTAFTMRKELPHIMQSLLKSGRWGKPSTKSLLPLKPKKIHNHLIIKIYLCLIFLK